MPPEIEIKNLKFVYHAKSLQQ